MHKKGNNIVIRVEAIQGEYVFVRCLVAALCLCIAAYLYFVGLSIMNVIANREAHAKSESLKSAVSMLEKEYFSLSSGVTPALGEALNMKETKETTYVRRAGGVASNQQAGEM